VTFVLVYLDSNIVIYLIEQPAQLGPRATARIAEMVASGDGIVVSDLTRLECRANAVATGDQLTLAQYDAFFSQAIERLMTLTTAVVDRATMIRSQCRFKTPDALHLAAAIEARCQVFLTNDSRLAGFLGIKVEILP
jgi:predicted nucleic acid-binding protein